MIASPQDDAIGAADPPATGPGERLRQARSAANLSRAEVSARLHLDDRTIEALETGDYEHLPAPTFVRGYLRGYARLLGLPSGPIVDAYDQQGFAPPALVADIAERSQARSTDFPVRIVTYLIVAGLVVLVVLWYNNQRFDPIVFGGGSTATTRTTPAPEPAPAGGDGTVAAAPGAPEAPMQRPPSEADGGVPLPGTMPAEAFTMPSGDGALAEPAAPPGSDLGGEPPAAGESAAMAPAATADAPAPPAAATAEPAAAPGNSGAAAVPATAPPDTAGPRVPEPALASAPAEPPGAPADAAAETPAPPAGSSRLALRFTGESWVEVYDRDGEKLFWNLVEPGRELELFGSTPIRVLIGNAKDVGIEFDGRRIDYSGFVERGIARFIVDEQGARPVPAAPAAEPAAEPQTVSPAAGALD